MRAIRTTRTNQTLLSRRGQDKERAAARAGSAGTASEAALAEGALAARVSDQESLASEAWDRGVGSAEEVFLRNSPQGFEGIFAPTVSTPAPGATSDATPRAGAAGRPIENHFGGPHGRYGEGLYNLTGSVKVNLDHIVASANDKPVITAVGVDPVTQDIWAAIGKVVVHFDKSGSYLGEYFIATPEGAPLRVSAIIVEPDRLIVASDSRGIYEFTRFDRNTSRTSVRAAVVPKEASPQNAAPR